MLGVGLSSSGSFGIIAVPMGGTDVTSVSLLARLKSLDDSSSWREFHQRYGRMLFQYALSRGATHADAEDAAQEVEMQFFQAARNFAYDASKGRFRSYLRTSLIRALGRRSDRRSRQPTSVDPGLIDCATAAANDEAWNIEWRLQQVRWSVRLIADEFDVTALRAFELNVMAGCSVLETAERLGISKWRVYRSRDRVLKRIRAKIGELEAGETT